MAMATVHNMSFIRRVQIECESNCLLVLMSARNSIETSRMSSFHSGSFFASPVDGCRYMIDERRVVDFIDWGGNTQINWQHLTVRIRLLLFSSLPNYTYILANCSDATWPSKARSKSNFSIRQIDSNRTFRLGTHFWRKDRTKIARRDRCATVKWWEKWAVDLFCLEIKIRSINGSLLPATHFIRVHFR